MNGWYVETWGGDRYQSVAWFKDEKEAREYKNKMVYWSGRPPKITKARGWK